MIEKCCATCQDAEAGTPCGECTGNEKWTENHLIAMGRRDGIEQAAKACDIAGKVAHLGMVADICAERIRALLEAKT